MAKTQSFLSQVVDTLLAEWGVQNLQDSVIFFTSARAKLFFTQELAARLGGPAWMPRWGNISEIMERIAETKVVEPLFLLPTLLKLYNSHTGRREELPEFYYWGERLLADFDQVDKYLCRADQLFMNLRDSKAIQNRFGLEEEQLAILNQFFKSFSTAPTNEQPLREKYMRLWEALPSIYRDLKAHMEDLNAGYQGHVFRIAAERLKEGNVSLREILQTERVAFVGFNALNGCEQALFECAKKELKPLFFWNCSPAMLDSKHPLEAGRFIRDNIARFPNALDQSHQPHDAEQELELVAVPSSLGQAGVLADYLTRHAAADKSLASSAIVLSDESLLMPVLQALPREVTQCNVTMGYPLRHTLVYSFLERLALLLESYSPDSDDYATDPFRSFLQHPYTEQLVAPENLAPTSSGTRIASDKLPPVLRKHLPPFIKGAIPSALSFLHAVADAYTPDSEEQTPEEEAISQFHTLNTEHTLAAFEPLTNLEETLHEANIADNASLFRLLLPRVFHNAKTSFLGQPLQGLQLMGFLETRSLDFETLYILSASEAFLPRVKDSVSFIPWSIQQIFGLPSRADREAMYAYYFETITMRAKRVVLLYPSSPSLGEEGEPSRFILQKQYLPTDSKITYRTYSYAPSLSPSERLIIPKENPTVREKLSQYIGKGGQLPAKELSPAAINRYISCPISFFFRYIADIQEQEVDPNEEFTPLHFGLVVHKCLEELYRPHLKQSLKKPGLLAKMRKEIPQMAEKALREEIGIQPPELPLSTYWALHQEAVQRTVNSALNQEERRLKSGDHCVSDLESCAQMHVEWEKGKTVTIAGRIDRIDRKADGSLEVLDFKTGRFRKEYNTFVSIKNLFSSERKDYGYILQILLYALMLSEKGAPRVSAALWFPRNQDSEYIPFTADANKAPLAPDDFASILSKLKPALQDFLAGMFDPTGSFTQTENAQTCQYCAYRVLCGKSPN